MKTLNILLLVVSFFPKVHAEPIEVTPLFTSTNWIAGLNIPLQIIGIPHSPEYRVQTEVISGSIESSQCKVMRDPFLPSNFLLRCLKPGTITLQFTFNAPTAQDPYAKASVIKYGPMIIHQLDGLKLPVEGGGDESDPSIAQGKALFASHCNSCHSSPASKKGRTANQIVSAINGGVSTMATLQGIVSKADSDKIAAYLKSL